MKLTTQFKKLIILICVFFILAIIAASIAHLYDKVEIIENQQRVLRVLPTATPVITATPTASPTAALKPTVTTKKVTITPTKAVDR